MSNPSFDPLLIAVAAPLIVAAMIALGFPKRLVVKLAYLAFAAPAAAALWVWWNFASAAKEVHGYAFVSSYSTGLEGYGIALKLGLNGISLPLFVLAGVVGLAAGLYALQSNAERMKTYLLLLLLMQAGLMGTFASVDVFFFYFFHELALIPTFIMVGIWGGRDRTYAAMMMTIYLTLGAMLSLLGLIAIYVKSGATSFDLMALRDTLASMPLRAAAQKHIFGLLLFGFGILVSLWPFHSWAPLGYGAAPSSAAMLHAGVLKKFGLYGMIQIALPLLPIGALHWSGPLAVDRGARERRGDRLRDHGPEGPEADGGLQLGDAHGLCLSWHRHGLRARRRRRRHAHGRPRFLRFAPLPALHHHPPQDAHVRDGADGRARGGRPGPGIALPCGHIRRDRPSRVR